MTKINTTAHKQRHFILSAYSFRAFILSGRFLRFAPFMRFCARIVPLTCKTTIMDPNGSIIAVLQVKGRFFRLKFAKNMQFLIFCPKIR